VEREFAVDAQLVGAVTGTAGVVVAAITGILSYRAARWNLRRDLEVDLRRQRLDALKKLWALSEPLAKYGRPASMVTAASLDALSNDLSHWYFAEGGMFLSETSRKQYFTFQDALQAVVAANADDRGKLIDSDTREDVRNKASALRASFRDSFKGFPEM
jgi:hypothetical protein